MQEHKAKPRTRCIQCFQTVAEASGLTAGAEYIEADQLIDSGCRDDEKIDI